MTDRDVQIRERYRRLAEREARREEERAAAIGRALRARVKRVGCWFPPTHQSTWIPWSGE